MDAEHIDGCAVHRQGRGAPVVCLPAFADRAASWQPLTKALSDRFEVAIVELPGLNGGGEASGGADVASFADLVARVLSRTWTAPLAIVGHSAGSVLAVRAAQLLDGQCQSIVSVEGNLTVEDAYFTGLAATHNDPIEYKADLVTRVSQLVDAGRVPASYAESLAHADAHAIWLVGRDIARQSAGDGLGREYLRAGCPTLYLWSRASTPQATQEFLAHQPVHHRELGLDNHWPWVVDAPVLADIIAGFAPTSS